jgi:hypothetical protein
VLPETTTSDDEVKTFVATLLAHDRIAFGGQTAPRRRFEAAAPAALAACPTHALRPRRDGPPVLTRIRFV